MTSGQTRGVTVVIVHALREMDSKEAVITMACSLSFYNETSTRYTGYEEELFLTSTNNGRNSCSQAHQLQQRARQA